MMTLNKGTLCFGAMKSLFMADDLPNVVILRLVAFDPGL
jgi:hypothetical protein